MSQHVTCWLVSPNFEMSQHSTIPFKKKLIFFVKNVQNYLINSISDEEDDDTVQAHGRPINRQANVVDPEVLIIAKIPHGEMMMIIILVTIDL